MRAPYIRGSISERFWPKVQKSDGCWLWTAGTFSYGYGQFRVHPAPAPNDKAHRVAYELVYGPIPDGLYALHRCDTPACVKVTGDPSEDHIFLGTNEDNIRDMLAKGRGRWVPAPRKLTPDQEREVRRRYGQESARALAREYGVDHSTIVRIAART